MKIWKIVFAVLFALWVLSPSGFAAAPQSLACFACYTDFIKDSSEPMPSYDPSMAKAKARSISNCQFSTKFLPGSHCKFDHCETYKLEPGQACNDESILSPTPSDGPNRGECLNGGHFGTCSDGSVCCTGGVCGDGGSCTPGNM